MNLPDSIVKRKSFKSFRNEPLSDDIIEGLVDFISELTPPEPELDWNFDTLPYIELVRISRNEPGIRAPHYLILRSERKNFCLQNTGFLGEMAILYLTAQGIASSWQGSINIPLNDDIYDSLPYISTIAFGMSDENFRHTANEADRKPLEKMSYGNYQAFRPLLEAARLAPSAYNRQPCAFVADDRNRLHLYRNKPFLNNPAVSYFSCIDCGAALAHLVVAANELNYQPVMKRLRPEPSFKKKIYQVTLEFTMP